MTETERSVKRRRLYRLVVVAAFCAAVVALGVFLWTRPRADDERRLQGLWESAKLRLTIAGNVAILEDLDAPRRDFSMVYFFRLSPRASPKRIILSPESRPIRPEWSILGLEFGPDVSTVPEWDCRGIYELEGDRLRVCLPESSSLDFPKSFDPAPSSHVFEFRGFP